MSTITTFRGIPRDVLEFLRQEFEPEAVEYLPKTVIKDSDGSFKALALAYIDREAATARINESGLCWSIEFTEVVMQPDYVVVAATLTIRLEDGYELKYQDRGEASGSSSDGTPNQIYKAACTDAFKRVVRFIGIGSYLTKMPKEWKPCEATEKNSKIYFKKWIDTSYSQRPSTSKTTRSPSSSTQSAIEATQSAPPSTNPQVKFASSAQVGRIKNDAAKAGDSVEDILKRYGVNELEKLTTTQASDVITALGQKIRNASAV